MLVIIFIAIVKEIHKDYSGAPQEHEEKSVVNIKTPNNLGAGVLWARFQLTMTA